MNDPLKTDKLSSGIGCALVRGTLLPGFGDPSDAERAYIESHLRACVECSEIFKAAITTD